MSLPNCTDREPIAITGLGCRLPGGVTTPEEFWQLMLNGVDAVSEIPEDRWAIHRFYEPDGAPGKSYSKWGGFLDDIEHFDADFFGIPDEEAKAMDPQQRLLLETAREAMDEAGHTESSRQSTGVFVGLSTHDYELIQCPATPNEAVGQYSATGTAAASIASNRLSYVFNLTGPSVTVDTACSSSLIAVHFACQSIWSGQCSSAIAAGANLLVIPMTFAAFSTMKMLSPDGRCKAFDESANGFVRGEGAGAIYLRPLSEALADGDTVYATILGTGSNQDGSTSGITLPSSQSQAELIRSVCASSGIDPNQVDYMEAHGTGTHAGDIAETGALGKTMGANRADGSRLPVGSVKTNIGHLESGSGMAGIIKTALVLKHGQIPPNLHFNNPNPDIDFDGLGLRVPTEVETLPKQGEKHIAAINSFGFGGSNAFALLQSNGYTQLPDPAQVKEEAPTLLPISAKNEAALKELARKTASVVRDSGSLENIAYTAANRRAHHECRLAVIGSDPDVVASALAAYADDDIAEGLVHSQIEDADVDRGPVFVFSGQGPQWWAMGQELLRTQPVFRETIEACHQAMEKLNPMWSLWEQLTVEDSCKSRMEDTAISQPAIFAIQVAMARLLESMGITPSAIVGHSVGEVAAAHIAGVYDLESAMRVIYHRGRTMSEAVEGRMLAAALTQSDAERLVAEVGGTLALAAVNSPKSVTLAGTEAEIDGVHVYLDQQGVWNRPVPVQYAFHSALMDPVQEPLLESLLGLEAKPAQIPLYSTVTGQRIDADDLGARYWWDNVRQSVLFAPAIQQIHEDTGYDLFIEVAAHPALSRSISECVTDAAVVPTMRRHPDLFPRRSDDEVQPDFERETLLQAIGQIYVEGIAPQWSQLDCLAHGVTTPLPTYAWQRKRYWQEDARSFADRTQDKSHPFLMHRQDVRANTWHCRADLRLFTYLGDHIVQKHTLFPAAGFVELAMAAAAEHLGESSLCLEDFEIEKALILSTVDDRVADIEIECQPGGYFFCHSRPDPHSSTWTEHTRGSIRRISQTETAADAVDFAAVRKNMLAIDVPQFYSSLREQDYHFGPTFQSLKKVWTNRQESLGQAVLHESLDPDGYHMHPVLLDACLQLVGAIFAASEQGNEAFLPVGFESIRLYKPIGREVWGHAKLLHRSPVGASANVTLISPDGEVMAECQGFRLQLAPGANQEKNLFYQTFWEQKDLVGAEQPVSPEDGKTWLVVGSDDSDRDTIATALQDASQGVFKGDSYQEGCDHIIYVVGRDSSQLHAESLKLVELVKELAEKQPNASLHLITRDGFDIGDDDTGIDLTHAPVAGLRRVIYNEHQSLNCRLTDWGDSTGVDDVIDELLNAEANGDDEVVLHHGQRLVSRLDTATPRDWDWVGEGLPSEVPCTWVPGDVKAIDQLQLITHERKEPEAGEVEVEIITAGLNFRDVMKALGMYPGDVEDSQDLGDEFAGIILSVGPGVTAFKPGDRVMGMATGSLATHLTPPVDIVMPLPDNVSFEEGVTMPVSYLTAKHALYDLAKIQRGERVLIHSATGGVGMAAVHLALHAGCEIFGTAGSPEKRAYLKELGVHHVMDSRSLDFADEIREITHGEGVDVVLNSLAGDAMIRSMELLRLHGRFLELGKRDIYGGTTISLMPFRNGLTYYAIDLSLGHMKIEELGAMLSQVTKLIDSGVAKPLPYKEFSFANTAEGFRYMAQGKHIGKNVFKIDDTVLTPRQPTTTSRLILDPEGTYLVTGGLRGLGLAMAKELVDRGCRHLVLTSKSGSVSEEAKDTLRYLQDKEVNTMALASDCSTEGGVAGLFAKIESDMPPLKGIVHAAAVYKDGLLINQDEESFQLSMGAKAQGAWHMHQQTEEMIGLDFFVMLSSVSAVIGNPGQANYVASNTYCDALAHYRQNLGLPALSVALEQVVDAGYAAESDKVSDHLARLDMKGITSGEIMEGLDAILSRPEHPANILLMTSSRWLSKGMKLGLLKRTPRYERLATDDGDDDADQADLREALHMAHRSDREQILVKFIQGQIAEILRTAPSKLPLDKPISDIGLDSLMMVEFGTRVERKLGGAFSVASLADPPSIVELADIIQMQMFGESSGASQKKKADPEADKLLGQEIEVTGTPYDDYQVTAPKQVLLTGASGFLGAHLLRDLFSQVEGTIYCLVRAEDETAGLKRVMANLAKYSIHPSESELERMQILAGDVSDEHLGLGTERYEQLSHEIDAIYHCAANVNFIRSYEKLRESNVIGTMQILRFAASGRIKPLHHMSTIAIFGAEEFASENRIGEDHLPTTLASSGYGESKRIGEYIVQDVAARGLPVSIYRTGFVIGSGQFGESEGDEVYWRILRSAIALGKGPDSDIPLQLSRVETVAQSIAWLSLQTESIGNTHHLLGRDQITLMELFRIATDRGYQIDLVETDEWISTLENAASDAMDDSISVFTTVYSLEDIGIPELLSRNNQVVCSQATDARIEGSVTQEPINAEVVNLYLADFEKRGLITEPNDDGETATEEEHQEVATV